MNPSVPYCLILENMENGTLDKLLCSLQSGPLPAWYIAYLKQSAIPGQSYLELVSADLIEIIQQIVSAMVSNLLNSISSLMVQLQLHNNSE